MRLNDNKKDVYDNNIWKKLAKHSQIIEYAQKIMRLLIYTHWG